MIRLVLILSVACFVVGAGLQSAPVALSEQAMKAIQGAYTPISQHYCTEVGTCTQYNEVITKTVDDCPTLETNCTYCPNPAGDQWESCLSDPSFNCRWYYLENPCGTIFEGVCDGGGFNCINADDTEVPCDNAPKCQPGA